VPRDERLYQTYPIDFHRHPKVTRLSDAAFRAFVAMNGEARIANNDGQFDAVDAEFMWDAAVLAELVMSHPTRPLVMRVDNQYVIRDYSEHQLTNADRERLAEISRKNGAKGGRPRKPRETHAGSEKTQPFAESESESGIEITTKTSKSQSRNDDANHETDSYTSAVIEGIGNRAGIIDPPTLAAAVHSWTGRNVHPDRLPTLVNHLVGKSRQNVKSAQAYVMSCLASSPLEVQQFIDENGLAS